MTSTSTNTAQTPPGGAAGRSGGPRLGTAVFVVVVALALGNYLYGLISHIFQVSWADSGQKPLTQPWSTSATKPGAK